MATSDVDQKILGRLAQEVVHHDAVLSSALFQVLGLSVLLARRLYRARKLRRLDTSRDTRSLQLYHHIIWLSREGLSIVELDILPWTEQGQQGPECRVMSNKLRASFYHVFCLFHNHPPVSTIPIPPQPNDPRGFLPLHSPPRLDPSATTRSPPRANTAAASRRGALRETIPSMVSEASYITNPYGEIPGQDPSPRSSRSRRTRPPGLPLPAQSTSTTTFLLPPLNFLPIAASAFHTTATLAASLLPGSHPLRLSVAVEHTAFVWDCTKAFDASRRVARKALRDVYTAPEEMGDEDFDDAAALVRVLGQMARRGVPDPPQLKRSTERMREERRRRSLERLREQAIRDELEAQQRRATLGGNDARRSRSKRHSRTEEEDLSRDAMIREGIQTARRLTPSPTPRPVVDRRSSEALPPATLSAHARQASEARREAARHAAEAANAPTTADREARIRALLIRYLDGDLSENARRQVQERVQNNEGLKARLRALHRERVALVEEQRRTERERQDAAQRAQRSPRSERRRSAPAPPPPPKDWPGVVMAGQGHVRADSATTARTAGSEARRGAMPTPFSSQRNTPADNRRGSFVRSSPGRGKENEGVVPQGYGEAADRAVGKSEVARGKQKANGSGSSSSGSKRSVLGEKNGGAQETLERAGKRKHGNAGGGFRLVRISTPGSGSGGSRERERRSKRTR